MPEAAAVRMMSVVAAMTAVEVAASMMAASVVTSAVMPATMVSATVMPPAVVAASVMASAMMPAMASGRGGNRHTQGSDYGRRKRKTPHHGGNLTGLFLGKFVARDISINRHQEFQIERDVVN
jgi:hypothetical protein